MAIIEITYDAKCKHCHFLTTVYEGKRKLSGCSRDGRENVTRNHGSGWDTVRKNRRACDRFVMFAAVQAIPGNLRHACQRHETIGDMYCKFQCRDCEKLNNQTEPATVTGEE